MRHRYFVGFRQAICKFFWRYCGIGYPQCPPLFLYQPAWQAPRVSLAPIPIQTPAMLASHADVPRGGYCHAVYFFTYKTDITL